MNTENQQEIVHSERRMDKMSNCCLAFILSNVGNNTKITPINLVKEYSNPIEKAACVEGYTVFNPRG